ncbi:MAG: hypothetical protein ACRDSP_00620 [Pseudonocardiaceae bacterium]
MSKDSPAVTTAKRLLDDLKARGFRFQRTAPGIDGPLAGNRVTDQWVDTIYIEGFSSDCFAWRQRRSSLIVPGQGLMDRQVTGGALDVLSEVLSWNIDN